MSIGHFGKCALCGKEEVLTFEHIPPHCAFNNKRTKSYKFNDLLLDKIERLPWETDGLKYDNLQKGTGVYSLCRECNSYTGTYYGEEYKKFAQFATKVVHDDKNPLRYCVVIKGVYPLRFVKQVFSLFCSIEPENKAYDNLRTFVLDKNKTGLDSDRFKLTMFFEKSGMFMYTGSVLLFESSNHSFSVSQLVASPMGFLLYLNPDNQTQFEGIDITSFTNYEYDEECDICFPIDIREVNTGFPLDFRTKDEFIKAIKTDEDHENNEEEEGHIKENQDAHDQT